MSGCRLDALRCLFYALSRFLSLCGCILMNSVLRPYDTETNCGRSVGVGNASVFCCTISEYLLEDKKCQKKGKSERSKKTSSTVAWVCSCNEVFHTNPTASFNSTGMRSAN